MSAFSERSKSEFQINDVIEVKKRGTVIWNQAKIIGLGRAGSFNVLYMDGKEEENVSRILIRRPAEQKIVNKRNHISQVALLVIVEMVHMILITMME